MQIGNHHFDFLHHVYVMGILNVTPDSFFDGGRYNDPESALDRALKVQEEGGHLLDIGAESSRPGAESLSAEEEVKRLLPILKKIVGKVSIPISVDTRKAKVAEIALKEGANLINDISALRYDFRMGEVIAQAGVPCILMHMLGEPKTMQDDVTYINVVSEVVHFLKGQIEIAVRMGISREKILVDPGIGFGKELDHNLSLLKSVEEFKVLEAPVVVGASRKRFIRHLLAVDSVDHEAVQTGSLGAAAIAAWNGASVIRVHDVKETSQVLRIVESLRSSRAP